MKGREMGARLDPRWPYTKHHRKVHLKQGGEAKPRVDFLLFSHPNWDGTIYFILEKPWEGRHTEEVEG